LKYIGLTPGSKLYGPCLGPRPTDTG